MKYCANKMCLILVLLLVLCSVSALSEEVVLVDNEQMSVKVKEYTEDALWGPSMKLYLENKTDNTMMFSIDGCAVNGYMNDPFWAFEVIGGSKANQEVSWMGLEEDLRRIDFDLRVTDSEDWMAAPYLEASYTLFPQGQENALIVERASCETDIVLFDTEEVTMIVTGFGYDEIWGNAVHVYMVNKTDRTLMFSVENATVNGFMSDPFWALEVRAGMRAYSDIMWSDEQLAENDITEIEQIGLDINVYDSEDWMADRIVEGQYTIKVK